MEWFNTVKDWAAENSAVFMWFGGVSLALLLLSPLVVSWLVVRLPTDYFSNDRCKLLATDRQTTLHFALLTVKNVAGALLVIAGLIMLVVPGQGLLTIVIGVLLLDFPGKSRLERWLVTRPHVWRSINWLRRYMGKPELQRPAD